MHFLDMALLCRRRSQTLALHCIPLAHSPSQITMPDTIRSRETTRQGAYVIRKTRPETRGTLVRVVHRPSGGGKLWSSITDRCDERRDGAAHRQVGCVLWKDEPTIIDDHYNNITLVTRAH